MTCVIESGHAIWWNVEIGVTNVCFSGRHENASIWHLPLAAETYWIYPVI